MLEMVRFDVPPFKYQQQRQQAAEEFADAVVTVPAVTMAELRQTFSTRDRVTGWEHIGLAIK